MFFVKSGKRISIFSEVKKKGTKADVLRHGGTLNRFFVNKLLLQLILGNNRSRFTRIRVSVVSQKVSTTR